MQDDIAIGVKVFSRVKKLQNLLDSIEKQDVRAVYVADDGRMTDEKSKIYNKNYDFDLTIYDLSYDVGLGYGRAHIVENFSEKYLLIVDSDHELLSNITNLRDILQADESLGGVAGLLYEDGVITGTCHDLFDNGDVLIRNNEGRKDVQWIVGNPFVSFDFIPNVAMFKRSCLEDYSWDPEYIIGKEHLDFYIGHKRRSDWKFGVCPAVLFGHSPGGNSAYVENRDSYEKLQSSRSYFLDKWDYEQIFLGFTDWDTMNFHEPSNKNIAIDVIKKMLLASPESVQKSVMRFRNTIRKYRNLRPL